MATNDLATLVARLTMDDSGFRIGAANAMRDMNAFEARARTVSRGVRQSFIAIGASWTQMTGILALGGAAVGVDQLADKSKEFERQLINLTHLGQGNERQMRAVEATIRRVGLAWGVGANGAARASRELLKVGAELDDLNNGALEQTVILARAQGATYEEAASIAGRAMTVFGAEAEDLGDIVQGINATVNAGAFELSDYALALQQGGSAARDAGLDLDDFNATLAVLQRQMGSTGSDTGTSLRVFLNFLVPKSDEAAATMRRLNLEFFNAQREFVGIEEAARRLNATFSQLTDEERREALRDILGMDAMRAGLALIESGAEGIQRFHRVIESGASVIDQARGYTEGWAGATDNLASAFEDLGIAIGESGVNDLLAALTNYAAGGVRNMSTGIRALRDEGLRAFNDPAFSYLEREGRRRSGNWFSSDDEAMAEALARMSPREIVEFLDQTEIPNRAPWEGDRRFLSQTYAGQRIREMAVGEAYRRGEYPRERQRGGRYDWDLNPTTPEPPRPRAPTQEEIDAQTRAMQDALLGGETVYSEIAAAMAEPVDADRLLAGAARGVDDMLEELRAALAEPMDEFAERMAEDWAYTLEYAFVRGEWDWDRIGDELGFAWNQMLWDVFLGDDVRAFMREIARGVKNALSDTFAASLGGSPGEILGRAVVQGAGGLWGAITGGFAGFFADGGFAPPGSWFIAGEEGPEPVIAGRNGATVIPAGDGMGGGAAITVHATYDLAGANGDKAIEAIVARNNAQLAGTILRAAERALPGQLGRIQAHSAP